MRRSRAKLATRTSTQSTLSSEQSSTRPTFMPAVNVQISRFVDAHQPGFVECVLVDASGRSHVIVEKVPVVSDEDLWSTSAYPRPGFIACEIEEEWVDEDGQALVRVSTARPWSIESSTGQTEFVVLASQVTNGSGLTV